MSNAQVSSEDHCNIDLSLPKLPNLVRYYLSLDEG